MRFAPAIQAAELISLREPEAITPAIIERIRPFLRHLPAPTKAIITSREYVDVADTLVLKGLDSADAEALMLEYAHQRGVSLRPDQRQRIYDLTSGLPLPIKLSVARLASGESFELVARWLGDSVGELPEYCIKGQVDLARRRNPHTWRSHGR